MNRYQSQSGFSLVEVMVSIMIFSIVMVALIGAASTSLRASEVASDRLSATLFASEGIEIVRISSFLPDCTSGCQAEGTVVSNCLDDCGQLYISGAEKHYTHSFSSGDETSKYSRVITQDSNIVTSTVSWKNSYGREKEVSLKIALYD